MTQPVIANRELNRATLARQLLLERSSLTPVAAVENLLGLQAQTPKSWYTALWSRLVGFDPAAFGAALEARQVVRIAVMRGTVHLLSAPDALTVRPLVQPMIERGTRNSHGKHWAGLDLAAVTAAARGMLEAAPMTFAELGARLHQQWPDRDAAALAQLARSELALVQTPPRGVWGKSGLSKHTTAEAWLGRPLDPRPSIDAMMLRYLAAFGPASVMDAQAWSGLTRLGEVFERLRPRLTTFRSEAGRELFDLPDAPQPDAATPAPVRLLPDYDNLLLSYADRARTGGSEIFALGISANGMLPGWVMIDGFLAGMWSLARAAATVTLTVDSPSAIPRSARAPLEREALDLLAFLEPNAAPQVRFLTAG